MSNLHIALLCIDHVRSLDGIIKQVNPINVFILRIKVDGMNPLFISNDIHFIFLVQIVRSDFRAAGKQYNRFFVNYATDPTKVVGESEAIPARADVRAVQIRAELRTMMQPLGTLVHVLAVFSVASGDDVAGVTGADVSTVGDVLTVVRAAAFVRFCTVFVVI